LRLFDPTPHFIKDGRPLLYDTHLTSGLGHTSCNSCHIDGRIDQLAWDLHGHGLVVMDPDSLAVSYRTGLLTTNMACASRPSGGVVVVGTEAINEVRFEPNLAGRFIRVEGAVVEPGTGVVRRDLNPHLDYLEPTIPFTERVRSIGDPRGVVCSPDGTEVWVSGMGSNNVIVHDEDLGRLDRIVVGNGPTGIVMDPTGSHVYVLNRFDATVTVLDRVSRKEIGLLRLLRLFDPTPHFIKDGRPLLYDTHLTSGLGHTSCNSCHIDGRIDQLAWDLGDPSGAMKAFNQSCDLDLPDDDCEDWHPMKGPMTTQTLTGLNGTEPLHWRGDREDFAAFDHAFTSILGNDADGTPAEMAAMQAFLGSIANAPNPNRRLDGSLPDQILGGDPDVGLEGFHSGELATIQCVTCHALPSGALGMVISANLLEESQSMKVPQLRNMYEKQGMDKTSLQGSKGFGFQHDGSKGTLVEFFERPVFTFPKGAAGDQLRRDIVALMMCWDTGTHPGVGAQAQRGGASPDAIERRDLLVTLALAGDADLVVRMNLDGRHRGGVLLADGRIQTDADSSTSMRSWSAPTRPMRRARRRTPPASPTSMGTVRSTGATSACCSRRGGSARVPTVRRTSMAMDRWMRRIWACSWPPGAADRLTEVPVRDELLQDEIDPRVVIRPELIPMEMVAALRCPNGIVPTRFEADAGSSRFPCSCSDRCGTFPRWIGDDRGAVTSSRTGTRGGVRSVKQRRRGPVHQSNRGAKHP